METIDIITRSLESYFMQLDGAEGRLKMLCPDGSAEVSGEFNVRKLARAGAEAVQEAIAAEREACAALCDSFRTVSSDEEPYHRGIAVGSTSTAAMIADLIRARMGDPEMPARAAPANQNHVPDNRAVEPAGVPNTWWP
jgi:hypothetical protein